MLLTKNPDLARLLISQSPDLGTRLEQLRRDVLAGLACFFEQLLAKLEPPPPDCVIAARCCVGSVHECVRHWLELPPDQRPALKALASAVAGFALQGIAGPVPQPIAQNRKSRDVLPQST